MITVFSTSQHRDVRFGNLKIPGQPIVFAGLVKSNWPNKSIEVDTHFKWTHSSYDFSLHCLLEHEVGIAGKDPGKMCI
jgi:hypothetical protein